MCSTNLISLEKNIISLCSGLIKSKHRDESKNMRSTYLEVRNKKRSTT